MLGLLLLQVVRRQATDAISRAKTKTEPFCRRSRQKIESTRAIVFGTRWEWMIVSGLDARVPTSISVFWKISRVTEGTAMQMHWDPSLTPCHRSACAKIKLWHSKVLYHCRFADAAAVCIDYLWTVLSPSS